MPHVRPSFYLLAGVLVAGLVLVTIARAKVFRVPRGYTAVDRENNASYLSAGFHLKQGDKYYRYFLTGPAEARFALPVKTADKKDAILKVACGYRATDVSKFLDWVPSNDSIFVLNVLKQFTTIAMLAGQNSQDGKKSLEQHQTSTLESLRKLLEDRPIEILDLTFSVTDKELDTDPEVTAR